MKKLLDYIRDFLKEQFSWKLYGILAIYIASIIFFDYSTRFQKGYLYSLTGLQQWLAFTLYYGGGYLGAVLIVATYRKQWGKVFSFDFWRFFLLFFIMLGFYKSFTIIFNICPSLPPYACRYASKVFRYASRMLTICLPAFLIWKLLDRQNLAGFFGINRQKFDWTPYGWMLIIMIPIIGLASFLPSFQNYYPIYHKTNAHFLANHLEISEWPLAVSYEIAYALGFVNVELFFRGVLVWGMFRFLGKDAVLAMVAVYAMFHFGKPLGETISSVFGGFILGAISYQTKSIWGGICIHVSIAWLMELFAYLQNALE